MVYSWRKAPFQHSVREKESSFMNGKRTRRLPCYHKPHQINPQKITQEVNCLDLQKAIRSPV